MRLKINLLSTLAAVTTFTLGGIAHAEVATGKGHGLGIMIGGGGLVSAGGAPVFGGDGLGLDHSFTPAGFLGVGPRPLGFLPGFGVPFGGFPSAFAPPGFVIGHPFSSSGWGVYQGGAVSAASQHVSGVHCMFGEEGLLAATVDSCENAGGAVSPSQMSYTIQCAVGGEMVMTPSSKSCERIGGKLASIK